MVIIGGICCCCIHLDICGDCDAYDETTSAEQDYEDMTFQLPHQKRGPKRRTFNDCIAYSEGNVHFFSKFKSDIDVWILDK
jgi:hypothetical protein